MRVTLERTGGFAGTRVAVTVDSQALSQEERDNLHRLVEASGLFQLPETIETSRPGADRFVYRVTVEDQARRHTVVLDEASVTPELRPLLDWLVRAARRGRSTDR